MPHNGAQMDRKSVPYISVLSSALCFSCTPDLAQLLPGTNGTTTVNIARRAYSPSFSEVLAPRRLESRSVIGEVENENLIYRARGSRTTGSRLSPPASLKSEEREPSISVAVHEWFDEQSQHNDSINSASVSAPSPNEHEKALTHSIDRFPRPEFCHSWMRYQSSRGFVLCY